MKGGWLAVTSLLLVFLVPATLPTVEASSLPVQTLAAFQNVVVDPARAVIYVGSGASVDAVDASTGSTLWTTYLGWGSVVSLAFSPDRTRLYAALAGPNQVAVVDLESRAKVATVNFTFEPVSIRIGRPDRLYASDGDGYLHVVDIPSSSVLSRTYISYERLLETSPNGSILLATSIGVSSVRVLKYNVSTDEPVRIASSVVDFGSYLVQQVVDWDRDVMYFAAAAAGGVVVASVASLSRIGLLTMELRPLGVAVSADGNLVLGLQSDGLEATLWGFDAHGGELLSRQPVPAEYEGAGLFLAPDLSSAYLARPFRRYDLRPGVTPSYPEPERLMPTPTYIAARVLPGIPPRTISDAGLSLDGMALPASYERDYLRAELSTTLADGPHTASATIRWGEQVATVTWNFSVDHRAIVGPTYTVIPLHPAPDEVLTESPTFIDVQVVSTRTASRVTAAIIGLLNDNLATEVLSPERFRATVHFELGTGMYTAELDVWTDVGEAHVEWPFFVLLPTPVRDHQHPSGFRVSIPEDWQVEQDVVVAGTKIELVATGPVFGSSRTNILVTSERDPSLREDPQSLREAFNETWNAIRVDNPATVLKSGPEFRTVAGHGAYLFTIDLTIEYYNYQQKITQKFGFVVSDEHDRVWLLLLTIDAAAFVVMERVYDEVLHSFVITATPAFPSAIPALALYATLGGALGAGIGVLVFALRRQARRPAAPQSMPGVARCSACGATFRGEGRFCGFCGSELRFPHPSESPRPPK